MIFLKNSIFWNFLLFFGNKPILVLSKNHILDVRSTDPSLSASIDCQHAVHCAYRADANRSGFIKFCHVYSCCSYVRGIFLSLSLVLFTVPMRRAVSSTRHSGQSTSSKFQNCWDLAFLMRKSISWLILKTNFFYRPRDRVPHLKNWGRSIFQKIFQLWIHVNFWKTRIFIAQWYFCPNP